MTKNERAKDYLGLTDVITARGRKLVRNYLDGILSGGTCHFDLSTEVLQLSWGGNESITAFVEVMIDGTPEEGVIAAWMIWIIGRQAPHFLEPKALQNSESVLANALTHEGTMLLACLMLANGPIPTSTILSLRRLIRHPDVRISVAAAVAIFQADVDGEYDRDLAPATYVLGTALRGHDQTLAGMAATGMIRCGLRHNESSQKLDEVLTNSSEALQYGMLQTIRQIGPAAKVLFDVTATIFADSNKHPTIREAAALALGNISAGSDHANSVLLPALSSSIWQVVNGALRGLDAAAGIPDDAIVRLIELLDDADESMRATAAMGLTLMRKRATSAVPLLIRRLGEEQNLDIAGELVQALSAIGEAAVPGLTSLILEGDGPRCELAMQALVAIGSGAVRTLAELLRETDSIRVGKMILSTLIGMGRKAMPAIPVLGEILDKNDNEEILGYAAMAIWTCGPSAVTAIEPLLRCVAIRGCDDAVGIWAERSLWAMREVAIRELRNAIEATSGNYRKNLERALEGMDVSFGNDLGRLLHFNRDDLLALFVDVGSILEEHGATSWRTMQDILAEKRSQGLLTPGYDGISQAYIGRQMRELSVLAKLRLTTHGDNQKGNLTQDGRAFLEETREYLRKKSIEKQRHVKRKR